jgi:hypothetical protein
MAQDNASVEPLRDTSKLTAPIQVLARKAGGETVLLNLDTERYFGLEGVGARFWELIEEGTTFGTAVTTLQAAYSVDRETLVADLTALLEDLQDDGLVLVDAA